MNKNYIYNVNSNEIENIIENDLQNKIILLDGKKCLDEKQLFKEIKKVLNLPENYGENVNAFLEYMTDFDEMSVNGKFPNKIIFAILDFNYFLSKHKLISDNVSKLEIQEDFLNSIMGIIVEKWKNGFNDNVYNYPPTPVEIYIVA